MIETHEYDDIINLQRHISNKHKPMSIESRAAQFAPFAALTGHEEAVKETERLTDSKKIIDENYKSILDDKINNILINIKNHPLVSITYFINDTKKAGGQYHKKIGNIKKVDLYERQIIFTDKTKINFYDILDIYEEEEYE